MRILVISATYPPVTSGGADYALRLCQKIVERGHEVHVLTSKIDDVVLDPTFKVYPVIEGWTWSDLGQILQLIRSINPDVVNLHFGGFLYNNHPMITFLPTILRWLRPHIRFVTHIEAPIGVRAYLWSKPIRYAHRIVYELFKSKHVDYEYGTLFRDSDHVITLSEKYGPLLDHTFPELESKMTVIPPPPLVPIVKVSKAIAREKLSLKSDQILLVYLGYLYPGKGIETLLESFKLANQKHKHLQLIIIGGSPEMLLKSAGRVNYANEMRDLARDLGIADKITWTGDFTCDSEIPSLYLRAADLGVMPWDWGVHLNNSSFGAAASHGLPIVTTWIETSEDVFLDKENVYLCPPKDPQAICRAIDDLLTDQKLSDKLSKGALALSEKCFSWNTAVDKTLALFMG